MFVALLFGRVQARAEDRAQAIRDAEATAANFKRTDPGLATFFERSAGYAVFPGIGKAAVGVGGAHGSGVLFDRTHRPLGKASMSQVTVGLQLGGQSYAEIIFFETPDAMASFEGGNFAFAAQASAVALKSGASKSAKYQNGVAVFTATKAGLMYEASIGGQKFNFKPFPETVR